MAAQEKKHTNNIQQRLLKLDMDRAAMLDLAHKGFAAPGTPMFDLDILAFGAAKRAISATNALKLLVESWNLVTARTLLRTHIDTTLRFSAAWLVDNPHAFAKRIIAGERIDKIRDRKGNLLRDAYLVKSLSDTYPWLPDVYKQLSGFVHFSGSHVFASIASLDGERNITFHLTEFDFDYPEESWIELIDCFREATEILAHYLHSYAQTKRLSPEQLAKLKEEYVKSQG